MTEVTRKYRVKIKYLFKNCDYIVEARNETEAIEKAKAQREAGRDDFVVEIEYWQDIPLPHEIEGEQQIETITGEQYRNSQFWKVGMFCPMHGNELQQRNDGEVGCYECDWQQQKNVLKLYGYDNEAQS